MHEYLKIVSTDVLVIGGGAAGAKAALDCQAAGLDTMLLVKGYLGRSGCSIFAGNLNFFDKPESEDSFDAEDRVRRMVEFSARLSHYLSDQEYLWKSAEWQFESFFPWIEELGFYLLRGPDGVIISDVPRRSQAWGPEMGMSGQVLMDLLRKLLFRQGVRIHEQTSVTRLLTRDGTCVGAVALDYARGAMYVISAKTVILATGHSNYLSLRSTATREGSASGWTMAYEAGAELQNIEMQWYHASDVASPDSWMRLHLYPNPLPGTSHRSRLENSQGETFFDSNWIGDNPVPYPMQLKYLAKEVAEGRARFDGGYFTDYTHVEPHVLERYIHQTQFLRKLGIDPTRDKIENAISYHMNVGGVHVDAADMTTAVPGLLAAGSVNSLVTGGLTFVAYDGVIAARTAVAHVAALGPEPPEPDADQVAEEEERIYGYFRDDTADGVLPAQVKRAIREAMWTHMNYVKTETSMRNALDEIRRIREEVLPLVRLPSLTRAFNIDWMDALDAEDMLLACELQIHFSLHRRESRGPFYREDFPVTDNVNWLRHIVGGKTNGTLLLRDEPVELPFDRPAEARINFFDADY